jgi:hypothetical protein
MEHKYIYGMLALIITTVLIIFILSKTLKSPDKQVNYS